MRPGATVQQGLGVSEGGRADPSQPNGPRGVQK